MAAARATRSGLIDAATPGPGTSRASPSLTNVPAPFPDRSNRFVSPTNVAVNRVRGRSYTSAGVPICTMRPPFMIPTRSDIVRASVWSCVT